MNYNHYINALFDDMIEDVTAMKRATYLVKKNK